MKTRGFRVLGACLVMTAAGCSSSRAGAALFSEEGPQSEASCATDCAADVGPCQEAVCDPTTGQCIVTLLGDGTACNDGQFCTVSEVCLSGVCGGGQLNDCGEQASECAEVACDEVSQSCTLTAARETALTI